jgi:hypothetical protein
MTSTMFNRNYRYAFTLSLIVLLSIIFSAVPAMADDVEIFNDGFDGPIETWWRVFATGTGKATIIDQPPDGRVLDCQNNVTLVAGPENDIIFADGGLKGKIKLLQGKAFINMRAQITLTDKGKETDLYEMYFSEGNYGLVKMENLGGVSPSKVTELASSPYPFNLDTWYLVYFGCIGNQLNCGLFDENYNNLSRLTYVDKEPISSGGVSIGTLDNSHAIFDNVYIGKEENVAPKSTTPAQTASAGTPTKTAILSSSPSASPPVNQSSLTPAAASTTEANSAPLFSLRPINLNAILAIISLFIAICSFGGYLITARARGREKRYLKKLIDDTDNVYIQFKMNARRCEAELFRLKDIITTDLKEGRLAEPSYGILDKRLDGYMQEIQERILDESLGSFPTKLKDSIHRLLEKGEIDEKGFEAIEKIILTSTELSDADRARLKESLESWRVSYLKKKKPE